MKNESNICKLVSEFSCHMGVSSIFMPTFHNSSTSHVFHPGIQTPFILLFWVPFILPLAPSAEACCLALSLYSFPICVRTLSNISLMLTGLFTICGLQSYSHCIICELEGQ